MEAGPEPCAECPITLQPMVDPVVAEDGHTYERAAIIKWLAEHSTSPLTRERMSARLLGAPAGTRVGRGYRVPIASLGWETQAIVSELRLQPRSSGYTSVPVEPVECAVECGDVLDVPRFWGVERWGLPAGHELADGEPMSADCAFAGTLQDEPRRPQLSARDACLESMREGLGGGLLVLPCGYGKTVVSLAIAAAHGRRTIVVVGKEFLMGQWREAIERFIPGARVGTIQQDRVVVDGCDVVMAMLQSLSQRAYDPAVLGTFGLAIFDEAHHVAARCFNRAVRSLPARCVLGLSATPNRRDGLGPLLEWSLGPVLFRAVRPPEDVMVVALRYVGGAERMRLGRDGKPIMGRMQTELADDPRRNRLIAAEVAAAFALGRHTIVLSERLAQLQQLRLLLGSMGVPAAQIGDYVGATKQADRDRSATRDVILSTYSMAREGLDIPRLDTLVMASPVVSVEQAVGRIQRPGQDKQTPLVIDVRDPFGPFVGMAAYRSRFYKANSFTQKEMEADGMLHEGGRAARWVRFQQQDRAAYGAAGFQAVQTLPHAIAAQIAGAAVAGHEAALEGR